MEDTRLKGLAVLTGAALLGVVAAGVLVGPTTVARDLSVKAEEALAAQGLDGVDVDFDGREAELSDGSADDLDEARAVVLGITGVRWVRVDREGTTGAGDDPAPDGTAVAPTLTLTRTAGGARISGTVPTPDASADIKARAADAFGGTIEGDLTVDPAVGPAPWVPVMPDLLAQLEVVDGLTVVVDGSGTVRVAGRTATAAAKDGVVQALAASLPNLEVVDRIVTGD